MHNLAGQNFESRLLRQLRQQFEVKTVSLVPGSSHPDEESSGEGLVLVERKPTLWGRTLGLNRLEAHWRELQRSGWKPDQILIYNLSPIYNTFLRRNRAELPQTFCLLADSPFLGQKMPLLRRWRYRLKPYTYPDEEMLPWMDGFISLSQQRHELLMKSGHRSLWMPGACEASASLPITHKFSAEPLKLGYYGAFGAHTGIEELLQAHRQWGGELPLHLCGYGKKASELQQRCGKARNQFFHGTLATEAETIAFGNSCDLLINPRPNSHGNENNFPSKIFSYLLSGAAILTTRSGGVDEVLGESAYYAETDDLIVSLQACLTKIAQVDRAELRHRAEALRTRVFRDYSWEQQGQRIAQFMTAPSDGVKSGVL